MVTEDGNVNLGAVCFVFTVAFYYQAGHGWYGVGCVAFASEAKILVSVDQGVDIVIDEALPFFLIDS